MEQKGKTLGGLCNRTACQQKPATCWNRSTRAYYCENCGHLIHRYNPQMGYAGRDRYGEWSKNDPMMINVAQDVNPAGREDISTMPNTITLTIRRPGVDLTVALERNGETWAIVEVLDEDGREATLTAKERANVLARAEAGEDESGY